MTIMIRWLLLLLGLPLSLMAAEDPTVPQRVMSINLCTDTLLMALADREQVASVTHIATSSPLSTIEQQAAGIPTNRANIEEVIALKPDLLLAQRWAHAATIKRAEELGYRTLVLEPARNINEAMQENLRLGKALGQTTRAIALNDAIKSQILSTPTPLPIPPTIVVYGPNGYTSGKGTLLDDLIRKSGMDNLATYIIDGEGGMIPIEALVMGQPDVFAYGHNPLARGESLAERNLAHPAVEQVADQAVKLTLPGKLWACGGPEIMQAFSRLTDARMRFERGI